MKQTHPDIPSYNTAQEGETKSICNTLKKLFSDNLQNSESKIWHGHPVWFQDGNPIVGYAKLKDCVQVLFWSGQSFDEPSLEPEGTYKASQKRYTSVDEIDETDMNRWLRKAQTIQWDYKNIVKKKGKLERIK